METTMKIVRTILLSTCFIALFPFAQAQDSKQISEEENQKVLATAIAIVANNEEGKTDPANTLEDTFLAFELAREKYACLQLANDEEEALKCDKAVQDKLEAWGIKDDKAFQQLIEDKLARFKQIAEQGNQKVLEAATAIIENHEELQKQLAAIRKLLPIGFELVQEERTCLQKASDKNEALVCHKALYEKLGKLDVEEAKEIQLAFKEEFEKFKNWTAEEKVQYIEKLNDSITSMKEKLPCAAEEKTDIEMLSCLENVGFMF